MTTLDAGHALDADAVATEVRRFVVEAGIGRPDARAALRWLLPWAAGRVGR
jgi:hypothetical protein